MGQDWGSNPKPKRTRAQNLNAGKSGNHRRYGPGTNGPVGCCSYQEAGRAVRRKKFYLAYRFITIDLKTRLGVI